MLAQKEVLLRSQGVAQQEVSRFLVLLIVIHQINLEEVTKQEVAEVGANQEVLREAEHLVQAQQHRADRLVQLLLKVVAGALVDEEVKYQTEDQFEVKYQEVVVIILMLVHEIV